MAKVVSCQPDVMEARVQSRASPRGISDGQGGTGTDLSLSASLSHVCIISSVVDINSSDIYIT